MLSANGAAKVATARIVQKLHMSERHKNQLQGHPRTPFSFTLLTFDACRCTVSTTLSNTLVSKAIVQCPPAVSCTCNIARWRHPSRSLVNVGIDEFVAEFFVLRRHFVAASASAGTFAN